MSPLLRIATAGLLATAGAAHAEDANLGRSLAATCANCHGTNGQARGDSVSALAGMPAERMTQTFNAYKTGGMADDHAPDRQGLHSRSGQGHRRVLRGAAEEMRTRAMQVPHNSLSRRRVLAAGLAATVAAPLLGCATSAGGPSIGRVS